MTPVRDKGDGTLSELTIRVSSLRMANTDNRRQMGGATGGSWIGTVGLEHTPSRDGRKGGKHETQMHLLIHLERRFQVNLQQLGPAPLEHNVTPG